MSIAMKEYNGREEKIKNLKIVSECLENLLNIEPQDMKLAIERWEDSPNYDILSKDETFQVVCEDIKSLYSGKIGTIGFYVSLHNHILKLKERLKREEMLN